MNTIEMKPPFNYYGGKQKLSRTIIGLIPEHHLYCEPFVGGAAIFWAKSPSPVEVLNDCNREIMNFYRVVQNDFVSLEKEVRISLHNRDLHRQASVIYKNPDMFNEVKRAWAVWVLATQSFSAILDSSFGYDISSGKTSKLIASKRESFTEKYAIRLQSVQIECADALYIIKSRDSENSFFYCDPPYFNSSMGHYDGYTEMDFDALLNTLSTIKGSFLLSSYKSEILSKFVEKNGWFQWTKDMVCTVNAKSGQVKQKTEVLTCNYLIK